MTKTTYQLPFVVGNVSIEVPPLKTSLLKNVIFICDYENHEKIDYLNIIENYSPKSIFKLPWKLCFHFHVVFHKTIVMLHIVYEAYMYNCVKFDRLTGLTFFKVKFF
jgi:hypothetical protein